MDWVAIAFLAFLAVFTYIPERVLLLWPKGWLRFGSAVYWVAIIFVIVYCAYLAYGFYTNPTAFIHH